MASQLKSKGVRRFFNDSMWSIAGLVLMNAVAQFAVYPVWNSLFGSEQYGNILYLLSIMNILAISMGSATNYALMMKKDGGEQAAAHYNFLMLAVTVLILPFGIGVASFCGVPMSPVETVLFMLLTAATMWRFYADVEFRLKLDYKGYFCYYSVIAVGYGIGIGLFWLTRLWALALLPGELLGLAFVYTKGKVLRAGISAEGENLPIALKMVLALLGSNLISNIIFNGDRLLLRTMLGGTAVTVYYLASLLGKTMSLITTPLNSVIVGYLARYKGKLTARFMHAVTAAALLATAVATALCTLASYVVIAILYPQDLASVAPYFWVANLAQVLYFVANMATVVLLRFGKARHQLYIGILYAVAFLALCIPFTYLWEIDGFCVALLLTCAVRLLSALILGYREAWRQNRKEE